MANTYHDPIPFGSPANSTVFNAPLHQLDEALQDSDADLNTLINGQSRYQLTTGSIVIPASSFTVNAAIPQTYVDLELVLKMRSTRASAIDSAFVQINTDTTVVNYTQTLITARPGDTNPIVDNTVDGTTPGFNMVDVVPAASALANAYAIYTIRFKAYTQTLTKIASVTGYSRWNTGNFNAMYVYGAYVWISTAAITRLDVVTDGFANFAAGTTYELYGIL